MRSIVCARMVSVVLGFLGFGLAGFLGGCGAGHCIDPAKVTYRLTRPDQVEAGKKAELVLELKNRSDDFMLVERVAGDQVDSASNDSLIGAEYGSLARSADGAAWVHNPIAQQETPRVFGTGLLPPGGVLKVQVELMPSKADGMLKMHYRGLDLAEASRWLYFSRNPGAASVLYEKLTPEDVGEFADREKGAGEGGGEEPRVSPFSRVILDDKLLENPATCTMELPYRLNL